MLGASRRYSSSSGKSYAGTVHHMIFTPDFHGKRSARLVPFGQIHMSETKKK
jgi:hypothetical protein